MRNLVLVINDTKLRKHMTTSVSVSIHYSKMIIFVNHFTGLNVPLKEEHQVVLALQDLEYVVYVSFRN